MALTPEAPLSLLSKTWGLVLGLMPLSFNHFPPQAPAQDSLVSLSSRINSSPDSSENLSEIPLSYKGVPLPALSA